MKAYSVQENVRMEMRLSEETAYAITTGGGKPGQGYPCVVYANDHGRSRLSGGEHNESAELEQPTTGGSCTQPDKRQQKLSRLPSQWNRLPERNADGVSNAHPSSQEQRRLQPQLHAERGDRPHEPRLCDRESHGDAARSESSGNPHPVCFAADLYNGSVTGDKCCSLNANTGASANHAGPSVILAFMGGQGARARSIALCADGTTPTLKSVLSGGNTVPDICYRRTDE